ncbi:MAG: M1 family metallopeptidase [Nitrospirota bacterium]|nr:M1 family metallopeptidase [Nitrospirota bacterium]
MLERIAGLLSEPSLLYIYVTRRRALASLPAIAGYIVRLWGIGLVVNPPGAEARAWLVGRPQGEDIELLYPPMPTEERNRVDQYRLPRHVIPTRYDLRLEPDLSTFTFVGTETVTVTVQEPTTELLLNAVELEISEASIEQSDGSRRAEHRATAESDAASERCRLKFAATISPGTWRLRLSFTGTLNDKLRGFYRSTYQDGSGQARPLAATQFEATDARRAFPCWDEPDFKAVFAATLIIDPAFTAVSNTAITSERMEQGKKIVQFADTIRMSTYLVAFVVGKLEASEPVAIGETPLRVWSVPGKKHLASFGREIGAFSLRFFEGYYGIPYPGDKLDLLAIPDFASGAMENLGAITFRETALLVDESAATHAELERIADVVAHEHAHMWFGDLVTMAWWNGLWLNEAFATFMEVLAVDAWKPEWQRWTTFSVSRAAAFAVDGLRSSRPIEYPVHAPKDADAMFDVLTYEKGASVLRMLEQHIGPDVFREGVRLYLRTHAYRNADTGDLWTSLGQAAKQPVPALMDGWIFQPGYPLIGVTLDGKRLRFTQRHFTYLADPEPGAAPSAPRRWQVPLQVRLVANGQSRTHRLLLTEAETHLDLPAGFESALVNEGGHGFYRVHYAPDLLARLLQKPERLAAIERFNLVNDAWAATVAGLMPLPDYLDLTARFRGERDRNVWALLLDSFHSLNRIIQPADRPKLEALVRDRVGPAATELGWTSKSGENDLTKQLRADLLRALGTLGNDSTVQIKATELYPASLAQPTAVDQNLLPSLIAILAHVGDAARYEDFLSRFHKAATPQEERRYLYALAAFKPVALLEQTLARAISGEIRAQDAPFIIRLVLTNVYGRGAAWNFVKTNWDTMDKRFPKQGLRRMLEGIVGLATPELEQDVHRFIADRKIDLGGKTLEQYLEQLRIAVTLREREGVTLSKYLLSS